MELLKIKNQGECFAEFISSLKNPHPRIPTGFSELDSALDGGLATGLYILGAMSSLGKTTFVMQMADQIAKAGHEAMIFSLEMSRFELTLKSISRCTGLEMAKSLEVGKAKSSLWIEEFFLKCDESEKRLIEKAFEEYSSYSDRVMIVEGNGAIGADEIRDALSQYIDAGNGRPVVFIDYLQILSPHKENASDKANIDYSVSELRRISRDFSIPVMAISSFNRMSYGGPATMESFKESGSVEYSSDVLMGLQFCRMASNIDLNDAKRKSPREMELVVLKNRSGETGAKLQFNYYPHCNLFCGKKEENMIYNAVYSRKRR
jgi:replicative DNA helicase